MVGHRGSSASSYLADLHPPFPFHYAVMILFKSVSVPTRTKVEDTMMTWRKVQECEQLVIGLCHRGRSKNVNGLWQNLMVYAIEEGPCMWMACDRTSWSTSWRKVHVCDWLVTEPHGLRHGGRSKNVNGLWQNLMVYAIEEGPCMWMACDRTHGLRHGGRSMYVTGLWQNLMVYVMEEGPRMWMACDRTSWSMSWKRSKNVNGLWRNLMVYVMEEIQECEWLVTEPHGLVYMFLSLWLISSRRLGFE